ncbi:MAG: (deoxy)nucleoside triphosphate pyrophosphohydrolase [Clostridiales bacterium]|nr:(deoxy)nucleoside triphosphate pyrophosphohydrolase [Clostridiales bacterium]
MEDYRTVKVVAAVIRRGNKIFATQRGYGEYKDGWEFPGGKVEPGESPRDALVREIREELDADITVGDKIVTVNLDYTDFYLSMDCFWASLNEGEQLKLLEHEAARWLSCDELDSVEWLPADVKVVEAIRKALAE